MTGEVESGRGQVHCGIWTRPSSPLETLTEPGTDGRGLLCGRGGELDPSSVSLPRLLQFYSDLQLLGKSPCLTQPVCLMSRPSLSSSPPSCPPPKDKDAICPGRSSPGLQDVGGRWEPGRTKGCLAGGRRATGSVRTVTGRSPVLE